MSATANIADVQDDILEDRPRLLNMQVRELKTVWKLVDHSGYEHPNSDQLRLAVLELAFRKKFEADNATIAAEHQPAVSTPTSSETQASDSGSSERCQQAASTPTPGKLAAMCNDMEKGLQEVRLRLNEQQHRIQALDREAEAEKRKVKETNLVMYNLPECHAKSQYEEDNLSWKYTDDPYADMNLKFSRIGTFSESQKQPRPFLLCFDSVDDKHTFLQHSKELRKKGLRLDDDLTRLQQKERKELSETFRCSKTKATNLSSEAQS